MLLRNRTGTVLGLLAAFSIGCLLVAVPSKAALIRHDRKIDQYRKRGAEPQFQCVGRDHVKDKLSASGVLVAPKWVLTCAHVARIGKLEDHEWEFDGKRYRPIKFVLHPSFKTEPGRALEKTEEEVRQRLWKDKVAILANGWDLALVQLDKPVENIKPARRYRGDKEIGRVATLVGYGMRGDGLAGPESPITQERLGGDNVIDAAGGKVGEVELTERVLVMDFDHPGDEKLNWSGDAQPIDLEVGVAGGDSGGGLFIKDGDDWYLAGILAAGVPRSGKRDEAPSRTYGQIITGVRVSSWNKWIDEVVGAPVSPKGETPTRPERK